MLFSQLLRQYTLLLQCRCHLLRPQDGISLLLQTNRLGDAMIHPFKRIVKKCSVIRCSFVIMMPDHFSPESSTLQPIELVFLWYLLISYHVMLLGLYSAGFEGHRHSVFS